MEGEEYGIIILIEGRPSDDAAGGMMSEATNNTVSGIFTKDFVALGFRGCYIGVGLILRTFRLFDPLSQRRIHLRA